MSRTVSNSYKSVILLTAIPDGSRLPPVADVTNRLKLLQECRLVDCHPGRKLTAAHGRESTSPILVLAL